MVGNRLVRRGSLPGGEEQAAPLANLRRARRMQQMLAVLQRVASRLGMHDTALALDLASAGAEADIERLLDGEAARRMSA